MPPLGNLVLLLATHPANVHLLLSESFHLFGVITFIKVIEPVSIRDHGSAVALEARTKTFVPPWPPAFAAFADPYSWGGLVMQKHDFVS